MPITHGGVMGIWGLKQIEPSGGGFKYQTGEVLEDVVWFLGHYFTTWLTRDDEPIMGMFTSQTGFHGMG